MLGLISAVSAAVLAASFGEPQAVTIKGWTADAMEPFIARDGQLLFFNSRNEPGDQTDIYWAKRIDALTFQFQGAVTGANSKALDGVPSLAQDGTFAFVSTRDYDRRHATLWMGRWHDERVDQLALPTALARRPPPWFNMDGELSADGNHLYFTENEWRPGSFPKSSDLLLAARVAGQWQIDPASATLFKGVNSSALAYAPATSADELELYFTRLTPGFLVLPPRLEVLVATRETMSAPFSAPARIGAITGFVEGPTVAPDGALYFHKKLGGRFVIMRSARSAPPR